MRSALPLLHANYLLDSSRHKRFTRDLLPQIWMLARTRTDTPFITSDHPVVRNAALCENGRELNGFGDHGASVIWPLSPTLALVIKDREFFSLELDHDGLLYDCLPDEVDAANRLQIERCYRRIFSSPDKVPSIRTWSKSEQCQEVRRREKVVVSHVWTGESKSRTEVRTNIWCFKTHPTIPRDTHGLRLQRIRN